MSGNTVPEGQVDIGPIIQASAFNGFAEFAALKGLDIDEMLAAAGFDHTVLTDRESSISLNAFSELLEHCARRSADPFFGVHYGEFYKPGSSGAFGYVLLNSATVHDAINNIVRYLNIFMSVRSIGFTLKGVNGRLHWVYPLNFHPRTQYVDLALTFVLERLRLGAGKNWSPVWVEVEHREPPERDEYERVFGDRLTFNAAENAIIIDRDVLKNPMPKADHQLHDVIASFCDRLSHERNHEGELLKQLRAAIVEGLSNGQTTLDEISQYANMAGNELRRELERMGTTFQYIMSDTRFALADRYLRDTDLPLTEIALLLGFSELSAFTRACNRWFDMPPSAYRKLSH